MNAFKLLRSDIHAVLPLLVLGILLAMTSTVPADDASQYNVFIRPPDEVSGTEGWIGDTITFFNDGQFHIYYLHEKRPNGDAFHPWYQTTTADFANYQHLGQSIGTGLAWQQDLALGTGSIIELNPLAAQPPTYYAFYTGHNWRFPSQNKPREGVMLATSQNLDTWSKDTSFTTLTAPDTSIYDRHEFRDPQVFLDPRTGGYTMLISTRNKFNGDGLLAEYRSNDLRNWTLEPSPFFTLPGGPIPEVANVFEMAGRWYLTYSKPANGSARGTYYRMSDSLDGQWSAEVPFDGRGFFAGNTIFDGTNRYITGWAYTREGETNSGSWEWAGNLVVHQIKPLTDGTFSMTAPAAVTSKFSAPKTYSEVSHFGSVVSDGQDFTLSGTTASINFSALNGSTKITGKFSFDSSTQDFGLTLGGSTNRILFFPGSDQIRYGSDIVVPIALQANTTYSLTLITEGTVAVLYVADPSGRSVATTMRNYLIQGNTWGLFSKGGQVSFTDLELFGIGQPGDFDNDGDVDGRDFLKWQRGESLNPFSASDLALWQANYSIMNSLGSYVSIPEPTGGFACFTTLFTLLCSWPRSLFSPL